jgi:hypothetical protein
MSRHVADSSAPGLSLHRFSERMQCQISHTPSGLPVFSALKFFGQEHLINGAGQVVKAGTDLVLIADISDPDIRPDVRSALLTLAAYADELESGKPTSEQEARREAEIAAAKKRQADEAAADTARRSAALTAIMVLCCLLGSLSCAGCTYLTDNQARDLHDNDLAIAAMAAGPTVTAVQQADIQALSAANDALIGQAPPPAVTAPNARPSH